MKTMKIKWLAALIVLILAAGNLAAATGTGAAAGLPQAVSAAEGGYSTETVSKPRVSFSEWREETAAIASKAFVRDITVSGGGNYLMTYRVHAKALNIYYYRYEAIYQGKGTQTLYGSDLSDYEIDNGKLLRYETMEETDLDVDQVITDHIRIQADDGSSFLLIFRPRGGKRDGQIDTVRVAFGLCDLTSDSYDGTESIEMLGVLRFDEDSRKDLTFGQNTIQRDPPGYKIKMSYQSDYPDGIGLVCYTNYTGTEVFLTQVIYDGYGELSTYDPAKSVDDITVGKFGIAAYSHNAIDAVFED